MRILLTNDDGIDAPGLRALFELAQDIGDLTVVAPQDEHSACGHRITINKPLKVERRERGWHAVHGAPADCVRLALRKLNPQTDWVLSGINPGGNLGTDVFMSGTVAAAREATLLGVPAISMSIYRGSTPQIDWTWAKSSLGPVLRDLMQRPIEKGRHWNVNLPDKNDHDSENDWVLCERDANPLPVEFQSSPDGHHLYTGDYHTRPRCPGTDVDVCFSGRIAVTHLRVDG